MMGLGDFLKESREKKNIRLADIASVTKIPLYQLKLIEENKWNSLPARPFLKGFLSAYCRYVGLDADEIWQRYLNEVVNSAPLSSDLPTETSHDPLADTPRPVSVPSKVFPLSSFLSALVLLALGGAAYWVISVGKAPHREFASAPVVELTPPSSETAQIEIIKEPTAGVDSTPKTGVATAPPLPEKETLPQELSQPEKSEETKVAEVKTEQDAGSAEAPSEGHRLEIEPEEKTWVKIVIDESPPVKLYLDAHQKTSYEAKNKIKLVLGNATGAQVLHNGKLTDGHVDKGSVKYYIFPWGSKFPQEKPREVSSEEEFETSSDSTE